MSLLQVERSSLDSVLIAVSAAYEALEDHAEYQIAPGEAHTIPVNQKARIRDKAGEAIDTLEYLLREAPEAPNAQHPDDIAADKFASAMKSKMAKQRAKGYSGWDDKEDCPTERLQQMLMDHIAKGDAVDVGNFAMMLWNRGEVTAAPKALEPLTDERKEAMAVYTPPFKYQHGYIFDSLQHMVADDDRVEEAVAARIRGWGKLSYLPNGAAIQDELGKTVADALTAYYAAHGITKGTP